MEFSASHRLPEEPRDECGHNYVLQVTLEGPVDAETGMVVDLKELKDVMETEIASRFDHRHLNDDTPYFRERAPTAEHLAETIFRLLDEALPRSLLRSVRLSPTPDLCVEVSR